MVFLVIIGIIIKCVMQSILLLFFNLFIVIFIYYCFIFKHCLLASLLYYYGILLHLLQNKLRTTVLFENDAVKRLM